MVTESFIYLRKKLNKRLNPKDGPKTRNDLESWTMNQISFGVQTKDEVSVSLSFNN